MKREICLKFLLLLLILIAIPFYGQKAENDPNVLYESFSEAYQKMDAQIIERLYLEDAVLLNLYDASNPNSINGMNNIKTYFADFFERCKKNGQELRLTFKITNREELENTILDNGFYELTIISSDKAKTSSYGKLSTILKRHGVRWRFMVDANTNTDEIEYRNAKAGSIEQPE